MQRVPTWQSISLLLSPALLSPFRSEHDSRTTTQMYGKSHRHRINHLIAETNMNVVSYCTAFTIPHRAPPVSADAIFHALLDIIIPISNPPFFKMQQTSRDSLRPSPRKATLLREGRLGFGIDISIAPPDPPAGCYRIELSISHDEQDRLQDAETLLR